MNNSNLKLKGIGASKGVAIAKAFLLKDPIFNLNNITVNATDVELTNLNNTLKKAAVQISEIIEIAKTKLTPDKIEIFEAHLALLNDVEMLKEIDELIKEQKSSYILAIDVVYKKYIDFFSNMDDEYFKERAADVADLRKRLLAIALNEQLPDLLSINSECIIVAHDLTPSETAQLDPKYVKGFLTDVGGRTSHAAIMARTLEIPAVLSLKNITELVKHNELVAMDGTSGELVLNPDEVEVSQWQKLLKTFRAKFAELQKYKKISAVTLDKHPVLIEANIGTPNDVPKTIEYGAEGVGLFRSEFLYMDSQQWPTEEEQFEAYKQALEQVPDKLVIIRTLDIGGDKHLNYFKFPEEMNPFLGYRALRLSLDQKDIFKTQLRALLRAGIYGKLGIMFPMVATVNEFLSAKAILEECKQELLKENVEVADNIAVGMMIEIPTAAVLAEQFGKYADFFSIGSNDLVQYSMAVDRMSEKVSYLYQPNNPAVLKLIQIAIDGAHKNDKIIGMCGEMAGELNSIPLLLGMGLDAFSMSASSIPAAKALVSKLHLSECVKLAKAALLLDTEAEVNQLVKDFFASKKIAI